MIILAKIFKFKRETWAGMFVMLLLFAFILISFFDFVGQEKTLVKSEAYLFGLKIFLALSIILALAFYFIQQSHRKLLAAYKQLDSMNQYLKTAITQSRRAIFEYDIAKKELRHYVAEGYFSELPSFIKNAPDSIIARGFIEAESVDTFLNLFRELEKGEKLTIGTFKIKTLREYRWVKITMTALFDAKGNLTGGIGIAEDVNDDYEHTITLKKLAERDSLTGLFNRNAGFTRIRNFLSKPEQLEQSIRGACMLDLDNFKLINDTLGHYTGDNTLLKAAKIIANSLGPNDIAVRVGGDEFFVFFAEARSIEEITAKAGLICRALENLYLEGFAEAHVSASVGVAIFPPGGSDIEDIYKKADKALYFAKNCGKNGFALYDESMATVSGRGSDPTYLID